MALLKFRLPILQLRHDANAIAIAIVCHVYVIKCYNKQTGGKEATHIS